MFHKLIIQPVNKLLLMHANLFLFYFDVDIKFYFTENRLERQLACVKSDRHITTDRLFAKKTAPAIRMCSAVNVPSYVA